MGYRSKTLGRYVNTEDVDLLASAQRIANGDGAAVELGDRGTLRLTLDVTAVGVDADEVLDVKVQTSEDNVTWRDLGSFNQATQPEGVQSERKSFVGADRYVRVSWTVAGTTPQFTFSVSGDAV